MSKWKRPKNPPAHNSGYAVIQSDDGNIPDYTFWFKMMREKERKYNQWRNYTAVPFSPAVNTGKINTHTNKMTDKHLKDIVRLGGEIVSHGRWHIGLSAHTTTAAVEAGATVIPVDGANRGSQGPGVAYDYIIDDGAGTSETFTLASQDLNAGTFTPQSPLVNAYPIGSVVRVTETSAINRELQGCVDDLAAWGIECKNHVYPWNLVDAPLKSYAQGIFNSGRTETPGSRVNLPGQDVYELIGYASMKLTDTEINTTLDEAVTNNGVVVFYGHGERDCERIEYIIETCMQKGVKIITHQQAVDYLNGN